MTLQEKFTEQDALKGRVDKNVEIAEDFAIGFLEFETGLLHKQVEGYFYFDYNGKWKTSKELLEIYKKGL